MKKLAKVFALVLTAAMSLSMMASAAFTDADAIVNSDAVNVVSSLGIIAGFTDGSFRGEETVTRAQMAKMIYTLKMGGKDDGAAYYKSLNANLSDISGHWAEGYIKYCASLGIVAGKGDGKFYPDEGVTGLQAAKMLLIVQGYDADKAGLVGNTWAMKTASLAAESEYFTNYGPNLDEACPRDYAALLIYNALDATYVVWSNDTGSYVKDTTNADCVSLGNKYFKISSYEGILLGVGKYILPVTTGTGATITAGQGKIGLYALKKDDGQKYTITDTTLGTGLGAKSFEYAEDVSGLLGQYVKVTADSNGKVYGVFPVEGENHVLKTTVNKVIQVKNEAAKLKIDGTTYKVNKDTTGSAGTKASKFVFEGATAYTFTTAGTNSDIVDYFGKLGADTSNGARNASEATFIDYDGDEEFDIVIVNPILDVKKITNVTSTKFTAGSSITIDEVIVNGELAKDKYVAKTKDYVQDKDCYTVYETVTGKATGVKKIGGVALTATISGTDYTLAAAHLIDEDGAGIFKVDSTYEILAINGIAYMFDKTAGTSSDIAVVTSGSNENFLLKLLKADGNTQKMNAGEWEFDSYASAGTKTTTVAIGDLVTYEQDGDTWKICKVGDFEEKTATDRVLGGYEGVATVTASTYDNNKNVTAQYGFIDSKDQVYTGTKYYNVTDDAVVFIGADDDGGTAYEFTVITGAKLNDFSADFGGVGDGTRCGYLLLNSSDEVELVVLVAETSMPGAASSRTLAYLYEDPYTTTVDGTKATALPIYKADGEKETIYIKGDQTSSFMAGDVFAFDRADDTFANKKVIWLGEIVSIKSKGSNNSTITFADGESPKVSSDVQIMYIDTDGNEVLASGDIPTTTVSEGLYKNARYYIDDEGKVLFLAVNTSGEHWVLQDSSNTYHASLNAKDKDQTNDYTASLVELKANDDATLAATTFTNVANAGTADYYVYNGNVDVTGAVNVTSGTLEINGKVTAGATANVTVTSKLVLNNNTGITIVDPDSTGTGTTGAITIATTVGATTYTLTITSATKNAQVVVGGTTYY